MEDKKLVLTAGKIWARIGLAILLLIGAYIDLRKDGWFSKIKW